MLQHAEEWAQCSNHQCSIKIYRSVQLDHGNNIYYDKITKSKTIPTLMVLFTEPLQSSLILGIVRNQSQLRANSAHYMLRLSPPPPKDVFGKGEDIF